MKIDKNNEPAYGPIFGVIPAVDAKDKNIDGKYHPYAGEQVSPRVMDYGEAFAHAAKLANIGG